MTSTASQLGNLPQIITKSKSPNNPFDRYTLCRICGCKLLLNGIRGQERHYCEEHRNIPIKRRRLLHDSAKWNRDERKAILLRDNFHCTYCGIITNGIDHVLPLTMGGLHGRCNAVAACINCNSAKGSKFDWRGLARLAEAGESLIWIDYVEFGIAYDTNLIYARLLR